MGVKGKKVDGRTTDLAFTWVTEKYGSKWESWRLYGAEWLSRQDTSLAVKRQALSFLFELYLVEAYPWASNAVSIISGNSDENVFSTDDFINVLLEKTKRSRNNLTPVINYAADFIDWIIEKEEIPNATNPFTKIKKTHRKIETIRSSLPYRYIQDLRLIICPKPNGSFSDWLWAQNQKEHGGFDRDWFEVMPDEIDKEDPDCVWRKKIIYKPGGKKLVHQIWSPVRAMVIYIKLHLPLRTYQVRMLDSGEADTWRYIDGKWCINDKHVFTQGSEKNPYERGMFRRILDHLSDTYSTALFVNTNKTADQNKDGEDRGYIVPWQHEEVFYWCQKLRNWQEKFNPILKPTDCGTLLQKHTGYLKSKQQLSDMGSISFLFRDRAALKISDHSKPLMSTQVDELWLCLLSTLQSQLYKNGETLDDGTPIKLINDTGVNNGKRTIFSLHCLRVSLITAYALDGKVPIPVISKLLAGHSRLITTLYYVKMILIGRLHA